MFNLNLPTLLTAISLLSLIDPVTAFDYKSAIQSSNSGGTSRTGVVPNRYVLEFDNSEDARQVAKRDGSASVSIPSFSVAQVFHQGLGAVERWYDTHGMIRTDDRHEASRLG
jgi:hypothetical protein